MGLKERLRVVGGEGRLSGRDQMDLYKVVGSQGEENKPAHPNYQES